MPLGPLHFVMALLKKLGKNLFLLSKLKSFTNQETRKLFYNAHIQTHIDYSSTVWDGASQAILAPLNSLHRRSAKLVIDESQDHLSTDEKLATLEIMPLQDRFQYNKSVIMFKICNDKAPNYLSHFFTRPSRTLRSDLVLPKPRLNMYKTSLAFSGTKLWNSLPRSIKSVPTLTSFKAQLHKHDFGT